MILGYISAFLYVIITTLSTLFIESNLVTVGDTLSMLFLAMLLTSLFFNLAGIKILKKAYKNVLSDLKGYFVFCLFISIIWVCSIYGVQHSNALIFNINFFLAAVAIAYFVQYKKNKSKTELVLFIISCAVLALSFINNYTLWIGILIALLGGASAYIYKRASFIYAKNHSASALEILMTRFIPIIIFLSFRVDMHSVLNIYANYKSTVLFFAFISFIIPTYLSQYSTNHIGAEQNSIISALIFPLCWFGDFIIHNGNLDKIKLSDLIIALVAFVVIIYPYTIKSKFYMARFK